MSRLACPCGHVNRAEKFNDGRQISLLPLLWMDYTDRILEAHLKAGEDIDETLTQNAALECSGGLAMHECPVCKRLLILLNGLLVRTYVLEAEHGADRRPDLSSFLPVVPSDQG